MKLEFKEIRKQVYHVRFDTRYDLCSTMVRIGEFYESPGFKGKVFTLAEFKKYYVKSLKKKKFTYYNDWSGYNIPSRELRAFEAKFKDISRKEQKFLSFFKDIKGKFYAIATFKRDRTEQETIDHEVTHAMFELNQAYRQKVKAYFVGKNTKELQRYLLKIGYSNKVMTDEMNAYLVNDLSWLTKKMIKEKVKIKEKHYTKYSRDLIQIKKQFE